jgi:hypothetical protein
LFLQVEAEQCAAGRDAAVDHIEETRVAVALLHGFRGGSVRAWLTFADRCALTRSLGTLPRRPGFALELVELFEFPLTGQIEVADARLLPLLLDELQVVGDGRL